MLNLGKKNWETGVKSALVAALIILGSAGTATQAASFSSFNNYSSGISSQLLESAIGNDTHGLYQSAIYPIAGSKMLVMKGVYSNTAAVNDFAYLSWQGGEENNYSGYRLQASDTLSFFTYTMDAPSCGIDIDFTDGSHLRWKATDQYGVSAALGNSQSEKKWLERKISLAGFAGKTISNLNLVQEADRSSGRYFECYFDDIRIYSQPVYYPVPAVAGTCSDSDGYRSFYTKGSAYGWHQQGKGPELKWWDDYCIGDYVYDFTCKTNKYAKAGSLDVWAESFKCPYGCSAGACLAQPLPLRDLSVKDLSASNNHNNYFIATIKGDNISSDFEIKWYVDGTLRKTENINLSGTDGLYGLALPSYVAEGWHTVSISVDTKNQISETNEANNSREIRFYLDR